MKGLFEFEDKSWFPHLLRKMQVEYIGWLVEKFNIYLPLAPVLSEELKASGNQHIIDLCSGNGGPVKSLMKSPELENKSATLSDLYPVNNRIAENIEWYSVPVNALNVPFQLRGMRTMFNAFHHFNDAEKKELILKNADNGFLVAEILQPGIFVFFKILLTTTIGQLLMTPFVKPFRWERILFTYFIPINLITISWDGLISVIKSESPERMRDRLKEFNSTEYRKKSGVKSHFPARISWFYVIRSKS